MSLCKKNIRLEIVTAFLFFFATLYSFCSYAADPQNTFAILIRGSNVSAHHNDQEYFYNILREQGVPAENIVVISSNISDPALNGFNGGKKPYLDQTPVIDYDLSKENIESAFKAIGTKANVDSQIFVYLASHGGDENWLSSGDGYIELTGSFWQRINPFYDELYGKEVDNYIKKYFSLSNEIVLLVDSCSSGNFSYTCRGPNRILITTADLDQNTYGVKLHGKTRAPFSYYFFSALKGQLDNGEKINADYNRDGIITYREAFLFAEGHKDDELPFNAFVQGVDQTSPRYFPGLGMDEVSFCKLVPPCRLNFCSLLFPSKEHFHPGDINGNKVIDREDFEVIYDFHWNFRNLTELEALILDVDDDSDVDTDDADLMLRKMNEALPSRCQNANDSIPELKRVNLILYLYPEVALQEKARKAETFYRENISGKKNLDKDIITEYKRRVDEFKKSLEGAETNGFIHASTMQIFKSMLLDLESKR